MGIRRVLLGSLTVLVLTLGLNAGTLGPGCGSCFGGIYTLDGLLLSGNATQETWRITYGLDVTGSAQPNIEYISALAVKVVSGADLISATTFSTPTSKTSWLQKTGNLNNSGCDGSGGGWICLQWLTGGEKLLVGPGTPVYSWVVDVTMKAGSLKTSDASIQANFDPKNGALMSEGITLTKVTVPEGASGELPILLSGLAILLIWRKRSDLGFGIRAGQ